MAAIIDEIIDVSFDFFLAMQRGDGNEEKYRAHVAEIIEEYERLGKCGNCKGAGTKVYKSIKNVRLKRGQYMVANCNSCSGTGRRSEEEMDRLMIKPLKRIRRKHANE